MMVPSAIEKLGELAVYSSDPTIRSIVSLKTEGYSESKKMGIEWLSWSIHCPLYTSPSPRDEQ